MRILSFYKKGIELAPVEVEVNFMRGLPQFQFMGQPDAAIKESQLRIRSAIQQQGFTLPKGQQVLVNLKPPHIKKSSRGLELAVAAAFLWKSGQVQLPDSEKEIVIYGELGLDGTVSLPDDIDSLVEHDRRVPIWSGFPIREIGYSVNAVRRLKDLKQPEMVRGEEFVFQLERPEPMPYLFPEKSARLIEMVAAGEHSCLLAGPAGSGKTTVAEAIHQCLMDPEKEDFLLSQRIGKLSGQCVQWRPFVSPHHTVPTLSMIGGGVPPFPGEITRAHGGTLLLDEFLEFPSKVREALREPMEKGMIVVSRRGKPQTYPARFLLLATSNLCVCGDLIPGKNVGCRFSLTKCRSYSERLSGPILDRFQILSYSHEWGTAGKKSVQQLRERVAAARKFALKSRGQSLPNSRLSDKEVMNLGILQQIDDLLPIESASRRRMRAILRVARTLADLDQSEKVKLNHFDEAIKMSWHTFEAMKRIFA